MFQQAAVRRLVKFILEREEVRKRKEAGGAKPWTKDPILRAWRFCNVHREDDAVTRWISQHWRTPHADDPLLWFAMTVARLVNNPATLKTMGYPKKSWVPEHFIMCMRELERHGFKPWGPAYIVSTNGKAMPKPEYVALHVLAPLWEVRKDLTKWYQSAQTLAGFHEMLMRFDGLGSFMAAQVVADLKYVEPLRSASDWRYWAASGPGSRRGMNRVMGRAVDVSMVEKVWLERLQELQRVVCAEHSLHAQDLQNCLCEFDKYERVRTGEGRPKRKYDGGGK